MHVIVNWKHNVDQERLYQEQLKDDVIEQRRLQQVNMEINEQLQQAKLELKTREDSLRQIEKARVDWWYSYVKRN
jgi:hypothetical protein